MAISATVIRAKISIADMTRHYYQDHHLTLAQHPSENENRLMIRLLAFAINAQEDLQFTKGLSTSDEPEIWLKDLTDTIELWIELGLPDESRLKKAANRSKHSILYCYDEKSFDPWFKKMESKLPKKKMDIFKINDEDAKNLESLYARALDLQINIDESEIMITDNNTHKTINISVVKVN
ncbi:YaeQ family protein [Marinicellulosiphila megalodicopiae]|uniref:YaeQ family protein n=1 Tax=Marinicellulosiphila megalodicopiae TaxID=2724896 RepID=UPI003BB00F8F